MSAWSHVDVYSSDYELIKNDLGAALFRGEIALLFGAGVSAAFKFPSWVTLVRDCFTEAGLRHSHITDDATFEQLTAAARVLRENLKTQYLDVVAKCLYAKAQSRDKLSSSSLLNALGALMMGSRRGRVREVWTLNYDDIIEWHLRTHGFVSQVVTSTPTLLRDVDVTIYHPHGFLPLDTIHGNRSKDIVFDDKSYAERFVGKNQPWRDAVQIALRSKVFLAVGLSWNDRLMKDLIIEASTDVSDRPIAFWLFGPKCPADQIADCLRNNVVPISLEFEDYPMFILSICEKAMNFVSIG